MVNPMLVDGQIVGGTAQGIGTALYEQAIYDSVGQNLSGSLSGYIIPGACEIPDIKIAHMTTPSPWTEFGIKGMGEGGAIGPPAAITNAVNDALQTYGVEIGDTPLSPRHVHAALRSRGERRGS
jgi:carbon-monoxide dehydrogenase large subunit